MEDINLHFNGDFHAITTANNALSAFIDNHLHQGNELGIDQRRIEWKRVLPCVGPPNPTITLRKARSFISSTRFHSIRR